LLDELTDVLPGLQSPWIIDGQRKGISSVEERIADAVLPAFQADKHKFMSAGSSRRFSSVPVAQVLQ